jgi:capsule polysaccharide export protein KpsC/LpsZ
VIKRTLAVGDYLAELYVDTRSVPPLYHYIVTSKNSAAILGWGQERSAENAERSALEKIADLNEKSSRVG